MRVAAAAVLAVLTVIAACEEAPPPPPPPEFGTPPPVAPPPPRSEFEMSRWDWCATQIPPRPRPADAPTKAECDEHLAQGLAQLRRDMLADVADMRDPATLKPFAERTDPNPDRGSWIQRLTPSQSGGCSFTEKPPSARPTDLKVLASSGNMDLLGRGNLLAHDHAIGFVESSWVADRPVIAVRQGMSDLWIDPRDPWDKVTLIIGADRFYCHVRSE